MTKGLLLGETRLFYMVLWGPLACSSKLTPHPPMDPNGCDAGSVETGHTPYRTNDHRSWCEFVLYGARIGVVRIGTRIGTK